MQTEHCSSLSCSVTIVVYNLLYKLVHTSIYTKLVIFTSTPTNQIYRTRYAGYIQLVTKVVILLLGYKYFENLKSLRLHHDDNLTTKTVNLVLNSVLFGLEQVNK